MVWAPQAELHQRATSQQQLLGQHGPLAVSHNEVLLLEQQAGVEQCKADLVVCIAVLEHYRAAMRERCRATLVVQLGSTAILAACTSVQAVCIAILEH